MSSHSAAAPQPSYVEETEAAEFSATPELVREIYRLLDEIQDPCSVATSNPMGLVEMGIIKSVDVSREGHVHIKLRLTSPFCEMLSYMQSEAIVKIAALDGVSGCAVHRDSGLEWEHGMMSADAQKRRQLRLLSVREQTSLK